MSPSISWVEKAPWKRLLHVKRTVSTRSLLRPVGTRLKGHSATCWISLPWKFPAKTASKPMLPVTHNFPVSDTSCVIHVPSEQSSYYYQVRSTNGFNKSEYSSVISLSTTNSKPVVRTAGDIKPFHFKANWEPLPWAIGYHLTVFEIDSLPGGSTTETILPRYNNILTPDTSFLVDEMDNERTYGYFIAAH